MDGWSRFSWRGELPPGERWHLVVEALEEAGPAPRIDVETTENEFLPSAGQLATLPQGIRWRVECLGIGASSGWRKSRTSD